MKATKLFAVALAVLAAGAATAATQSSRTLDASADGNAVDTRSGDVQGVMLDVDGDVIVVTSDHGVDRTAHSRQPITAVVTLGETSYTIPVYVNGEGVSLVQTGASPDAWRLTAQGTSIPAPGDRASASFRGELTLLGSEDGGYTLTGDGILRVTDTAGTATYHLSYAGSASFE